MIRLVHRQKFATVNSLTPSFKEQMNMARQPKLQQHAQDVQSNEQQQQQQQQQ